MYTIIWGVLQEWGILLGGCLTVKNYWGLLSVDTASAKTINKTSQSMFQIVPAQ